MQDNNCEHLPYVVTAIEAMKGAALTPTKFVRDV